MGSEPLDPFARAPITKYHRPGGWNFRNILSHGAGGQKSKVEVWTWDGRFLVRLLSLACRCTSSLSVFTWLSLYVRVLISHEDTSPIGLETTVRTSL